MEAAGWIWKTVRQSAPHKDSAVAKKDGEGAILCAGRPSEISEAVGKSERRGERKEVAVQVELALWERTQHRAGWKGKGLGDCRMAEAPEVRVRWGRLVRREHSLSPASCPGGHRPPQEGTRWFPGVRERKQSSPAVFQSQPGMMLWSPADCGPSLLLGPSQRVGAVLRGHLGQFPALQRGRHLSSRGQ